MALSSFVLRWAFGAEDAPASIDVALFNRSKEIVSDGYSRASVKKGGWRLTHEQSSVVVRFGPFTEPAEFDRVVLSDGAQVLEEFHIGASTFPVGAVFEFEPFVVMPPA